MDEIKKILEQDAKGYEGKILSVAETTSHQYFGDKKQYDDRKGYSVEIEVAHDKTIFTEFFAVPKPIGLKDSKVYAFHLKYGELPKKGMRVSVSIEEGFYRVAL